jgi:hypothetical protein
VAGWVRRYVVTIGVGLLLSACGPATAPLGAAPTPKPTPNTLDLKLWTVSAVGTGPTATQANGGIDLVIPAGAVQDPKQGNLAINLSTSCQLTGDFDLQLDYTLVKWPARNSVRVGMAAGHYSAHRSSNTGTIAGSVADNLYVTDFAGTLTSVGTQDTTGRLRLTRVGATITGYYHSSGAWVKISSAAAPTEPMSYGIAAWTDYNTVVKSDVSVNVKNLTVAPPPSGCS